MLWRKSKSKPKSTSSGFLVPCQPTLAAKAPSGPKWIHEVKHDGYRLLARKHKLVSRNMTDFTDHFPGIAAAMATLPEGIMIDGEVVILHPDGHSDFDALRSRERARDAVLIAFDLLQLDGQDLRSEPLEIRRAKLAELLILAPDEIMLSKAIEGDGPTIFRHACSMGLEGIVSKRLGSRYRSGRSPDWLKTKNREFKRR